MSRLKVLSILIGLAASLAIAHAVGSEKYLTCQVFYSHDKTITVGSDKLEAELADSRQERINGLAGRKCIKPNQAMLFVFDKEDNYPFWMKDMKFPIDIVWVDVNHHVVKIEPEIQPSTYPRTFVNDKPAQYVLELHAGQAAKLGINEYSVIQF